MARVSRLLAPPPVRGWEPVRRKQVMVQNEYALRLAKRATVACIVLALIGCQAIREVTGLVKHPPDEFAVVTHAPLVLPPDLNLRAPQVGAAERGVSDPTLLARAALFPDSKTTTQTQVAETDNSYSRSEIFILSQAKALDAGAAIRQQLAMDATTGNRRFARATSRPAPITERIARTFSDEDMSDMRGSIMDDPPAPIAKRTEVATTALPPDLLPLRRFVDR
jgi:hypothetical protein